MRYHINLHGNFFATRRKNKQGVSGADLGLWYEKTAVRGLSLGVPSCEVSTGKIRDLFHFTKSLHKKSRSEAAALFRNKHPEDYFSLSLM